MKQSSKLNLLGVTIALVIAVSMFLKYQNNSSHAFENKIETKINRLMTDLEKLGVSGSVLISRKDKILVSEGYGVANRKINQQNTSKTAFDIGSIAKTFTAAAILKLQQDGNLKLTDTIDKYFDSVPTNKRSITIHQLLTHSSGLENYHAKNDFQKMDKVKAIKKSLSLKLRFKPQTDWDYSNAGYALLGAIIEKTSGKSLQQYIWHNILNPLEIRQTGWFGENRKDLEFARGYSGKKDKGSPPEWDLTWALIGSGGMYSTVEDLYKWQQAVFKSDFFDAESKNKILTPLFKRWTAGWDKSKSDHGQFIEKGGSGNYGFTSLLRHYPEYDLTIILTLNSYHESAKYKTHILVIEELEQILFGALPKENIVINIPEGKSIVVDAHSSFEEWKDAKKVEIEIEKDWKVKVYFKQDKKSLYFRFSNLKVAKNKELYPEVLIDTKNNKSKNWDENDWWFHTSYSNCEGKSRFNAYDTCKKGKKSGWNGNNFPLNIGGDVEMSVDKKLLNIKKGDIIGLAFDVTDTNKKWFYYPKKARLEVPETWANFKL